MKNIVNGYKSTRTSFEIKSKERDRKSLFFTGIVGVELGNNFCELFKQLKNTKTKDIFLKKYQITSYKKQEWVLNEKKILETDADTLAECLLQIIESGKIKDHLIIGCTNLLKEKYMLEIYPNCEGSIYVFLRTSAEWHNTKNKEYILVCK